VLDGRFRADLYQRLSTCVVVVPPLRERPNDVPLIAKSFLEAPPLDGLFLAPAAMEALCRHRFPGNVRELRNVLMQAALSIEGSVIDERAVRGVLDKHGVKWDE